MTNFRDVAAEFAGAFITAQRSPDAGGGDYIRLKEGAPEWMTDVIREAHMAGDMLPDDWRYRFISQCADSIAELLADNPDEPDLSDEAGERIDGLVPVYNSERFDWLASHSYRASYVDEACEDCAAPGTGIVERIGYGIYAEIQEIWDALSRALSDHAEQEG